MNFRSAQYFCIALISLTLTVIAFRVYKNPAVEKLLLFQSRTGTFQNLEKLGILFSVPRLRVLKKNQS